MEVSLVYADPAAVLPSTVELNPIGKLAQTTWFRPCDL